ncbi:hypothetical protein K493DRAFT_373738 [Basidiobolus meristosporus CBS 931.73]|uniref:Uncharacterized protein n=1 Tax=Basidiobolus meristosporus CBS 931.73 TaxID=1314790 RepID=A0A1Y1Y8T6_9FUNG|nr:hypothetical protein K493DRAFT_373738 [Basidiobolus meristosporus CBS 931.73]|eukprot:ORX94407.1 hypothetical protein K493DRAFT_373738 [Basidiobolus meristosporus CBS 931.73]
MSVDNSPTAHPPQPDCPPTSRIRGSQREGLRLLVCGLEWHSAWYQQATQGRLEGSIEQQQQRGWHEVMISYPGTNTRQWCGVPCHDWRNPLDSTDGINIRFYKGKSQAGQMDMARLAATPAGLTSDVAANTCVASGSRITLRFLHGSGMFQGVDTRPGNRRT